MRLKERPPPWGDRPDTSSSSGGDTHTGPRCTLPGSSETASNYSGLPDIKPDLDGATRSLIALPNQGRAELRLAAVKPNPERPLGIATRPPFFNFK